MGSTSALRRGPQIAAPSEVAPLRPTYNVASRVGRPVCADSAPQAPINPGAIECRRLHQLDASSPGAALAMRGSGWGEEYEIGSYWTRRLTSGPAARRLLLARAPVKELLAFVRRPPPPEMMARPPPKSQIEQPPPRVGAVFGPCAAVGIAVAGGVALGLATDGFSRQNRGIRYHFWG